MNSSVILKDVLPLNLFYNLDEELYTSWNLTNQSIEDGKIFWGKDTNQENSLTILEASSIIRLKLMKHTLRKIKLCRVQVNGLTCGQITNIHPDYVDEKYYTFIFFTNPYWELSWGGEFVCINPYTQQAEYAPYIPNTGCLIPSNWNHYGKSPNMITDNLRVTIGFSYHTY
jgi:hypothetical protein